MYGIFCKDSLIIEPNSPLLQTQIQQLENQEPEEGGDNPNKALIILLSTSANIVSKYSSMVGVDRSGKQVTGTMGTRHVPTPVSARHQYSGYASSSLVYSTLYYVLS